MTACGRNFIKSEFSRNKWSPRWGATPIEAADEALTTRSAGNLVRGEFSRNKRSPQCGAAPIEAAEEYIKE